MTNYLHTLISWILYYGFVRRRIKRENHCRLFGFSLVVPVSVFHPKFYFSSSILVRHIRNEDLRGLEVLDLGCGSGILSLAAARQGATVLAVDLNPAAVDATRENARTNGLSRNITAIQSDLFDAVSPLHLFNLILWNPPFFGGPQTNESSRAWLAGEHYEVVYKAINGMRKHMLHDGRLLLILSSAIETERDILAALRDQGFRVDLLSTHRRIFESLRVYACSHAGAPQV